MKWKLERKDECYDLLCEWWRKHEAFGGGIIPKESLPERIFFVINDGIRLFAVPVYVSDSDFCYIGWVTSNPNVNSRSKVGALEFLYNIISAHMEMEGFKRILSKANNKSLQRISMRAGFESAGETTYYIKNL